MNKITKTLLLFLVMLFTSITASAYSFEADGIYYNIPSPTSKTVSVTSGDNKYSGEVVIPSEVTYNGEQYAVMSIGNDAFSLCSGLTSITIPNSITSIGTEAFSGCSGSTKIVVEEGNSVYDSRDNCNAIIVAKTNALIQGCKNTIIPNDVTSIGGSAFYNCSGLTSITIPNSVTSIGSSAFSGCSGLTSVTIPNSVTSIGDYAFYGCSGLTKIISKATTPPTCKLSWSGKYYRTFSDNTLQYTILYVPSGCKNAYESVDPWRNFWNIEEKEFSSVESILADNNVNVSVENGNIVIASTDNAKAEVYNVNGQCVYSGTATNVPVTAKGVYIVRVNGKTQKVIMK